MRRRTIAAMNERPYDLVLYGASGFVGRQTVTHLAHHGEGVRSRPPVPRRARVRRTPV